MYRNFRLILLILFPFTFCLFTSSLQAQNSRFERVFLTTSGGLATGKVIYIVNTSTGDSLHLSEVSGKPGYYRRDSVPYGEYRVYIDGSLSTQSIWVGSSRIRTFIESIDSDADNKVETAGIEDQAITAAKLANTLDLSSKSVTLKSSEIQTAEVADSNITRPKLSSTVNVLLNNPGSGVAYAPDDEGTEFKITGLDTSIGVKALFNVVSDTTALKSYDYLLDDGAQVYLDYGGLSGWFFYDASLASYDHVVTYPSSTAGGWQRIDVIEINPKWAGALGDGSNDDIEELQLAVSVAKSLDLPLQFRDGIYAISDTLEISLAYGEAFTIRGIGSGDLNVARTAIKPTGTAGGLRFYTTGTLSRHVVIENLTIVRDTSATKRAAIGIEIDSLTNATIRDCNIEGFNYGVFGDQCGQLSLINTNLRHNIRGFSKENHADGIRIENGFIGSNDSIGVDLTGISAAFSINNTELSHQPIHIKAAANSSITMYSNRMESADSCAFLLESGCKLVAYEPSILPHTSNKIIARMSGSDNTLVLVSPDIDSGFSTADSTIIIANVSSNYVHLWHPLKASLSEYINVYDQANATIFTPSWFTNAMNASIPSGTAKTVGRIFQLHKKATTSAPTNLIFGRKMDESGTVFNQPMLDNADIRVSINGDSTNFGRQDYLRNVATRQDVTLEASGNFTRDTLNIDAYVTSGDYTIQITPRFASDSLITAKVHTRNTNGQVVVSIYHQGVNGISGQLYYYFIYKAKAYDY